MNAVIRAKRDLIFSVSVFGTIGIFANFYALSHIPIENLDY